MIAPSVVSGVCAALNRHGARYVVVGGVAGQLWGVVRATKDLDILIEPTVENARLVLDAVVEVTGSWGLARDLLAEDLAKRPVTVIGDLPRVDILTVAFQVGYAEAARDATVFDVDGVEVPTASLEHLIASKRTGRLRDAADVEELLDLRRLREEG